MNIFRPPEQFADLIENSFKQGNFSKSRFSWTGIAPRFPCINDAFVAAPAFRLGIAETAEITMRSSGSATKIVDRPNHLIPFIF